jgi:deoxycytidylate deaminase
MAQPQENLFVKEDQTTYTAISKFDSDELIIGLCGPIGSPFSQVSNSLKSRLEQYYGYTCIEIKLSKFIVERLSDDEQIKYKDPSYERYAKLIDNGNNLRNQYRPEILAELAIYEIALARKKREGNRYCYIINSIKNISELNHLQAVYRHLFYFVGVYSSLKDREKEISKKGKGISLSDVYRLVDRDSGEELDNGQTVRDTFPLADFFLRVDSNTRDEVDLKIERFLHLIFQTKIVTPTKSETAMNIAAAAAVNSACLSRQVGAAISDIDGEVVSIGWNDVPCSNGGVYNNESVPDNRCAKIHGGMCQNTNEKSAIIGELSGALEAIKKTIKADNQSAISQLKKMEKLLKESRINSLIEFSRSVHAEMHAIILGAQKVGSRLVGGTLYCTTYPCHSCARHILLAGIKTVYYIEPYRKSMAIQLHGEAITENEKEKEMLRILMFDGISPNRYIDLFSEANDGRKTADGMIKVRVPKEANPKTRLTLAAIPELENVVVTNLYSKGVIKNDSATDSTVV